MRSTRRTRYMADAQDGTITDKDSNDFLTDNMGMVRVLEVR